jgi:hypothetical protein
MAPRPAIRASMPDLLAVIGEDISVVPQASLTMSLTFSVPPLSRWGRVSGRGTISAPL